MASNDEFREQDWKEIVETVFNHLMTYPNVDIMTFASYLGRPILNSFQVRQ